MLFGWILVASSISITYNWFGAADDLTYIREASLVLTAAAAICFQMASETSRRNKK